MKKTISLVGAFMMAAQCLAIEPAVAPHLQFETVLYNFGPTSQVAMVSGVFKFKNTGDAVLNLDAPKPSCGCTVAELKPNILPPGATGELAFSMTLGLSRGMLEKHIDVHSNDPLTPNVTLTVKVDYTPLHELAPLTLAPNLAFGVTSATQYTTLTRTDGKPLEIVRLDASKPWIIPILEPANATNASTAQLRIVIQREGSPRRFNEWVHLYAAGDTNTPATSLYIYGQIMGEVSLEPEALYWSIDAATKSAVVKPEAQVLRRVTIRAATGQKLALNNPQSTIKGIKVELVPKEAGKVYELVARLDEVPAGSVSGIVSFDTSVAGQARMEVPVIVNVFQP